MRSSFCSLPSFSQFFRLSSKESSLRNMLPLQLYMQPPCAKEAKALSTRCIMQHKIHNASASSALHPYFMRCRYGTFPVHGHGPLFDYRLYLSWFFSCDHWDNALTLIVFSSSYLFLGITVMNVLCAYTPSLYLVRI